MKLAEISATLKFLIEDLLERTERFRSDDYDPADSGSYAAAHIDGLELGALGAYQAALELLGEE